MPFVVISSERADETAFHNALAHDALAVALGRLQSDFIPVIGSYKGKTEKSFIVQNINQVDYDLVRQLAEEWAQESILLVEDNGVANLVFIESGDILPVGDWQYAGTTAPDTDAWTLLGGFYFVTV